MSVLIGMAKESQRLAAGESVLEITDLLERAAAEWSEARRLADGDANATRGAIYECTAALLFGLGEIKAELEVTNE